MVGRDQYGYIKGPYCMVEPGAKPPREHNKVESKKLHKLGRFPKLCPVGRAAGKAFLMRIKFLFPTSSDSDTASTCSTESSRCATPNRISF